MKPKVKLAYLVIGIILLVGSSCAGFPYSFTGRAWTIRPGETINSDKIRARREVTFSVSGTLDAGTISATVYREGILVGEPLSIGPGSVDEKMTYAFENGLWSFSAQADESAQGELYLSIYDR